MKYVYSILLCICVGIPMHAFAYDLRVSPDVVIDKDYVSDSNLYIASFRTWFDAFEYKKDVVSTSINQNISGVSVGDVTLLGKTITMTGESFGDNRIIADTVYVSGITHKDLIIVARRVVFDKNSKINGDTLVLAQQVELSGQFLGKTQITASKIFLSGSIIGTTTLTGTKIILNNGTKIYSALSYFSPQRAVINQGVDLKNQLNFNQIESIKQNDFIKRIFLAFVSFWAIIKLIATLFVLFILTHLFRIPLQRIIEGVHKKVIKTILIGGFGLIAIPVLIIILFGSLVLIPVSIIVASLYVVLIMLLPSMSAVFISYFYHIYIKKQQKISIEFIPPALALIGLTVLNFIPYVGDFVIYLLYILSFGAILKYLYELIRRKKISF